MRRHSSLSGFFGSGAVALMSLLAAGPIAAQALSPTEQYLWLVPNASHTAQQGFVRLTNRSDVGGGVVIWGLDAQGVRSTGTISVALSARQSLQMTSQELELGTSEERRVGKEGGST